MIPSKFLSNDDWQKLAIPIDPYMRWADATSYRALLRDDQLPQTFSFIAEGDSNLFLTRSQKSPFLNDRVYIEPIYRDRPLRNGVLAKYWTVRLDVSGLSYDEVKATLLAMITANGLTRLQMGFPRGASGGAQQPEPLPPPAPCPGPHPPLPMTPVVLAVIDDGCAFAHQRLLDSTGTRVVAIWNQSTFDDVFDSSRWGRPCGFKYGGVIYKADLDFIMFTTDGGGLPNPNIEVDELACYQRYWKKGKRNRGMQGRESHGAAITMIAAGSSTKFNDFAGKAPVVFVDLPLEQVEISSGRWMAVNGLDAMRFIEATARDSYRGSKGEANVPLVINLSSGSSAGPHDGTSMLECAMDELLENDDNLAITLAAGNSRLAESHVSKTVSARGNSVIEFFVPHSKLWETYVELWLPAGTKAKSDVLNRVQFVLHSPDGGSTAPVSLSPEVNSSADFIKSKTSEIVAGIQFSRTVVQSLGRSMVLVAIAATNNHPRYVHAAAGAWRVEITNKNKIPVTVDAWIERDEVVFGARRPQLARFFDSEASDSHVTDWAESPADTAVKRSGTFSNIASGQQKSVQRTFAVGAGTGDYESGFASPYSGAPMDGRPSPSFVATADRGPARPGILVNGNYRGALRHINGTSVTAPLVARWIANEMAAGRTRTWIEQLIVQKSTLSKRKHPHTGAVAPNDGTVFVTTGIQTVRP